jgi:hypothetical protein
VGSRFPITPEDVTAEWLTGALRDAGVIDECRVASVTFERIGEGVGFVGQIARIIPSYDAPEANAPVSVIGKFPAASATAREFAASYGLYRCEVNVYTLMAHEIPLRIPRCYFGAMNPDATEFLLLLEDLSLSGRLGDQVAGCALADARIALEGLATLHAAWWNKPRLDELAWLPLGTDLGRISLEQAYPHGWQPALERYSSFFSPEVRAAAPTLNERLLPLFERFQDAPLTIMHADWRLDNFFFGRPNGDYDFAVIDWQIANRGWGAYDVAYFMSTNLEPDVRREHGDALLRMYFDELVSGGVHDYAFDTLQNDFRMSIALYLANMIGNVTSLDVTNERGVALFELMLGRVAQAVDDVDALGAID